LLLPGIFAVWHRGKNLGLHLVELDFDGVIVGPHAIERLNYWLEADGAWRASLLTHFEAEKVLATVIRRNVRLNLGSAGGGRWPSGTTFEELFRNRSEGIQSVLWPEV
jgi:hypothetical protein